MSAGVVIVDNGGANIASLTYAFQRLGCHAELSADPNSIRAASRVVLPGVGAAADAMQRLRERRLIDVIRSLEQPVLGICLGMQLLAEASEEDDVECLGVIPGTATRLPASTEQPVPNMGWCPLTEVQPHPLLDGIANGEYFYFLHSYALPPADTTVASANHAQAFTAVASHRNFLAAQFHPERSSAAGARLLRNFVEQAL